VLEYKPLNAARECGVTIFSNKLFHRVILSRTRS
jgi:hypothetical protein